MVYDQTYLNLSLGHNFGDEEDDGLGLDIRKNHYNAYMMSTKVTKD